MITILENESVIEFCDYGRLVEARLTIDKSTQVHFSINNT